MTKFCSQATIADTVKYYNNNLDKIREFCKKLSREEMFRTYHELRSYLWNEKLLGKFLGEKFAIALSLDIEYVFGKYELEKYLHLVLKKDDQSGMYCKTEEEFDKWCIKYLFDYYGRMENPIFNPRFW